MGHIGAIRFEFDFSLSATISMMYRGTYQPEVRHALRKLLSPGDVFVDVGANIGYVSALALDAVGTGGLVCALEPVPTYCARLRRLADLNPEYQVEITQAAASDRQGTGVMELMRDGNIGINSLVPGFVDSTAVRQRIEVELISLAELLLRQGRSVAMVKIDVEGYEPAVLRSLIDFTRRSGNKPAILCEISPDAWANQGESLDAMERDWIATGYVPSDPLSFAPIVVDRVHQSDILLVAR
jgi:FkbM family methyltransferase